MSRVWRFLDKQNLIVVVMYLILAKNMKYHESISIGNGSEGNIAKA